MKDHFLCFKLSTIYYIIIFVIMLAIIFVEIKIINLPKEDKTKDNKESVTYENIVVNKTNEIKQEQFMQNNIKTVKQKKQYETMPEKVKGYKVIGQIEIPKLKVKSYILSDTSKKALNISVTKLCGPEINHVGNFCIAGHNFLNSKMFGKIKQLEKKDKIILTDTYGDSITYEVYDNFKTTPKDVSCLEQNTEGDIELTLITCTAAATKRVIIKATEIYN